MENTEKITESIAPFLGLFGVLGLAVVTLLLIVLLIGLIGMRRQLRSQHGDQRAVLREIREDIGDDVAESRQQVQESMSAGLMRLQDLLDQRIGGLQRQMLEDSAALRGELGERFEVQRRAVADSLADGRLVQQRESAELRASLEAGVDPPPRDRRAASARGAKGPAGGVDQWHDGDGGAGQRGLPALVRGAW